MKHGVWIAWMACLSLGLVGCGGEESEAEVTAEADTAAFMGDCAVLVDCHIELQQSAIDAGAPPKSDDAIRAECETLVTDDYGNDEAACTAGLEDYGCAALGFTSP